MKKFGYTKKVEYSFFDALIEVEGALKDEGFGVLHRMDIKEKLKKTIKKDIDNYMIFGACNPALAFEALSSEYEIGLLLPCNIIIYSKNNEVFVSSIIPTTAMDMIDNDNIKKLAEKVEKILKRVIDSL